MIKGNSVELIPAKLEDRRKIYEWGCQSEITKYHAGPPDYPEHPVPTWEEFCEDYVEYYFDGSEPKKGRGFIIIFDEEPIGFISYASFHLKRYKTELDIWMNCEENCGKGFGTDAIIALGGYLNKNMLINELIMRPSIRNTRAIRSYMKAGFEVSKLSPEWYLLDEYVLIYGSGDYGIGGDVLLVKKY
jgi:RimJ/RimL family protein N-acetyltransferase